MYPEISVIITTYNTEKYVERAIRSVLNQTFENFEIVIVDDGSTDGTVEIVRRIADDRIRLIVQPKNAGLSAARNQATVAAQGTWVAILDSDDWYAPQRLSKLLELAKSYEADMVADNLNLTELDDTAVWSTWFAESGQAFEAPIIVDPVYFVRTDQHGQRGLHIGFTKPMFRRDFLLKHDLEYDEDNKFSQDFWFYFTCLIDGAKFVVTPEAYYFQFFRLGSLMRNSQIERLEYDIATAEEVLSSEIVQSNPDLIAALRANLELHRQHISYYYVAEPLKAKNWLQALQSAIQHPTFFGHFARKLPSIVSLRIERYLGIKNNASNSMLPR